MGNGFPFSRKTKIRPAARTKGLSGKANYMTHKPFTRESDQSRSVRGLLSFVERVESERERGTRYADRALCYSLHTYDINYNTYFFLRVRVARLVLHTLLLYLYIL